MSRVLHSYLELDRVSGREQPRDKRLTVSLAALAARKPATLSPCSRASSACLEMSVDLQCQRASHFSYTSYSGCQPDMDVRRSMWV